MNRTYLVFFKPTINRIRCMRTRDWIYLLFFVALLISPSFLSKFGSDVSLPAPSFNVDRIASLFLFLFSLLLFGLAKPNYRKISNLILPDYMVLLKLVPSEYRKLICYSQIKKTFSTLFVSSALLLVYLSMSGERIEKAFMLIVLVAAILIFIRTTFTVFPALISFEISTKRNAVLLKILSIIIMILSAVLFFMNYKYSMTYLPNYVLACSFHSILTRTTENALFLAVILMAYASVFLGVLLMNKRSRRIRPAYIYEASIYQTKLQNKVSHNYNGFIKLFPLLSKKLKLIAAKETLQFLNEYNNMFTILFNSMLLVVIAIVSKDAVPFSVEKLILYSSIGYLSFYVGLTSVGRDNNSAWLYKLCYPKWVHIAVAKYISNLLNAAFAFLFFSPILLLVVLITKNSIIGFFVKGLHWSIILIPFSAISLGLLMATILPVKLKGSDEKISYSYMGIEGIFYLIVVLCVVAPIMFVEDNNTVYTSLVLVFYSALTVWSLYRLSKRLRRSV